MEQSYLFADAESPLDEAAFAIIGVPFDKTCSHRSGCATGPKTIRDESYNFETLVYGVWTDLEEVGMYDAGDVGEKVTVGEMVDAVMERVAELVEADAFPILLGGEHSISEAPVVVLKEKFPKLKVVYIDAHLDYRKEYEGNPQSHACAARRMSEIVGAPNIVGVGVRSMCSEEMVQAQEDGLGYVDAFVFKEEGRETAVERVMDLLKLEEGDPVYLSLDIDGIDPAFAPGVGTPEPFGLDPMDVRLLIHNLAPHLVGFDVMEVNDSHGNTAALAARLTREVIGLVAKHNISPEDE